MSVQVDRATLSLHNMMREMMRKGIELPRIAKCATQLIMAGMAPNSVPVKVRTAIVDAQNNDGGFVANADTIWNIKLMEYFPEYNNNRIKAIKWLLQQRVGDGYGRGKRDIGRIPITGLALYLIPELVENNNALSWLEELWCSEQNSLTYKAAYTLMAFSKNDYFPNDEQLILHSVKWLEEQQEDNGGFGPWKNHPVGANIYCTGVSCIGLLSYPQLADKNCIAKAYNYMVNTQLKNGIWPYHELEDGAAWGLRAMVEIEKMGWDR